MRDLPRAEAIIKAVVQAVSVPVTVKMRTGWNESEFTAPELAKRAEQAGAAAITVHGRTREQFYSGCADREKIRRVVEAVSIPVIGNGDIVDGPSALDMMERTGCQGVMIGRGAQGNPWIFPQIKAYLQDGTILEVPTERERYEQIKEHFEALLAYKGEYIAVREMRSHGAWYTKGLRGSAATRERMNRTKTAQDFFQVIDELIAQA